MYKIKELVDENYDFAMVYPEKQNDVRQNTGLDFNLENIAKFLQKQTNNFTIDNTIAKDLDMGIYKIVSKFEQEQGRQRPEPDRKPQPPSADEQEWTEAIQALIMLDLDDSMKEAVETFVMLLGDKGKAVLQDSLSMIEREMKDTDDKDEKEKLMQNKIFVEELLSQQND